MSDHVVNDQNEASNIQRNDDKLRIVGAIFALNQSSYSFLDFAISVCGSHVKIMLRNKQSSQLILPRATWITFIKERKNVEQFLQSPIGSSRLICDLVLELVKLPGDNRCPYKAVKLKLTRHGEICVVPKTLQYLFEIEKSVEDEYSKLCQYTDSVNENEHFVNNIYCDITERLYYYEAINIILQDFDKKLDTIVPIDSPFNTKFVKFFAFKD